ncbi:hypothetical protein Tco_0079244 [Tanacetum coccineum]
MCVMNSLYFEAESYKLLTSEEEKKLWWNFKEFDKDDPNRVPFKTVDQHKRLVFGDNPIIRLTGNFAITAFNESIDMYVKKGENTNIHDLDIVECKYLKANRRGYFFRFVLTGHKPHEFVPLSAFPLNDELQQARSSVAKAGADVLLEITHRVLIITDMWRFANRMQFGIPEENSLVHGVRQKMKGLKSSDSYEFLKRFQTDLGSAK